MSNCKTTVLSSLGAGLEYYDFITYAMLASYLAKLFFPHSDSAVGTIEVFAVFALGYFARPIGGIVFGHLGDRYGRKITFLVSVLLMAFASLAMGLLPNYSQLGITSAVLLTAFRLIQGLAFGAELPGVLTFLNEHVAKSPHRGIFISCMIAGVSLGGALGSLVTYLVNKLPYAQLMMWGWRIPFLVGGVLAIVGFFIRRQLTETPYFEVIKQQNKIVAVPLFELLKNHWRRVLVGLGVVFFPACYVLFNLFLPTYAHQYFHYSLSDTYLVVMIGLLWCTLMLPICGAIVDQIGARRLFIIAALLIIVFGYPLFSMVATGHLISFILFIIIYQSIAAAQVASYMPMLADFFPTSVRYTGVSLCYNTVFSMAGLTPLLLTALIRFAHSTVIVAWLFIVLSIVAAVSAAVAPKKSQLSS